LSKEVAERFVEALHKLEEDRDVEALVEIHTDDCDVGNVAVPKTFSGHDGLREFWTSYRDTFGDMKSEFRNVFADDAGQRQRGLLRRREPPGDRRQQGQPLPRLLRPPHRQRTSR
jgi:hypothetical protein